MCSSDLKELVTASYKLEKLNMGFLDKYRPVKYALEFSKFAVAPLLVAYAAVLPLAAVGWFSGSLAAFSIPAVASYVGAMMLTYISGDAVKDWSRDDPKVRYLRIHILKLTTVMMLSLKKTGTIKRLRAYTAVKRPPHGKSSTPQHHL